MKIYYNGQEISMENSFAHLTNKPEINGHELVDTNNRSTDIELVWHGTQFEFDTLQEINENCIYIIQKETVTPIVIEANEDYTDYQLKVDEDINTETHVVIDAINDVKDHIGDVGDLKTATQNSIVEADNSIVQIVGDRTLLTTTEKDVMVSATNEITDIAGKKSTLITTHKDNAVNAVNDLVTSIGDKASLTTEEKDEIVKAVNELQTKAGNETALATTAKTNLVGAVNEVKTNVGDKTKLTTSNKTSMVLAINEEDGKIGNLSSLTTSTKTDLVSAINSINGSTIDGKVDVSFTGKNNFTLVSAQGYYIAADIAYVKGSIKRSADVSFYTSYPIPIASDIKVDGRSAKSVQAMIGVSTSSLGGVRSYGPITKYNNEFRYEPATSDLYAKGKEVSFSGVIRLA